MKKYIFLALCAIQSATCATSTTAERIHAAKDAVVEITELGANTSDKAWKLCKNFSLSRSQVISFFEHAEVMPFEKIHNEFEWLPCYVRGTLTEEGMSFIWEISAGGTAVVEFNDQTSYLGCKSCAEGFIDKGGR